MEKFRTALRERARGGLLGRTLTLAAGVAAACLAVSGCDSVVGIPGDGPDSGDSAATSTTTVRTAAPGSVEAAQAAVNAWAADLRSRSIGDLAARCWAMAPRNVRAMYADPQPILDALTRPGVHSGTTTVWKNGTTTVITQDRDAAGGYACPHVVPSGGELGFNDADARHTVRRYLARAVGKPVDPADQESAYPLVCAAAGSWDPDGNGKTGTPPLATNPEKLGGVKSFVDESIKSEWPRDAYITVSVPVTSGAGVTKKQTFTLESGSAGYCIGDVSG